MLWSVWECEVLLTLAWDATLMAWQGPPPSWVEKIPRHAEGLRRLCVELFVGGAKRPRQSGIGGPWPSRHLGGFFLSEAVGEGNSFVVSSRQGARSAAASRCGFRAVSTDHILRKEAFGLDGVTSVPRSHQ